MFEHWLENFLKLAYDLEPKIKHNYLSEKKYCTIKWKKDRQQRLYYNEKGERVHKIFAIQNKWRRGCSMQYA